MSNMLEQKNYDIIELDQPDDILTLCKHCRDMKTRALNPTELVRHVIGKLKTGHCTAFGSRNGDGKLIGGIIVTSIRPSMGPPMLWVDFLWSRQKDFALTLQFLQRAENLAKIKGITRMGAGVNRGFNAWKEKTGWKESSRILHKEVI